MSTSGALAASPFLVGLLVLFAALYIQHVIVEQRARDLVKSFERVLADLSTDAKTLTQVDAALDAGEISMKISFDIDRIQVVSAILTTVPGVLLVIPITRISVITCLLAYGLLLVFVIFASNRLRPLRRSSIIPHVTYLTLGTMILLAGAAVATYFLKG